MDYPTIFPYKPIKNQKERNPKMDKHRNKNRSRKNQIILYLSDDEKFILDEKTKLSGMTSKSAFLRQLIMYGFVFDVDYTELHEYNTLLSRIGTNLNQIAKRMNATGHIYDADVKQVKKLMEEVWRTQKSMLSKQPYLKQ